MLPRTPNSAASLSIFLTPHPWDSPRAPIRNEVNLNTRPYSYPLQFFLSFASFISFTCSLSIYFFLDSLSLSFSLSFSLAATKQWDIDGPHGMRANGRTTVGHAFRRKPRSTFKSVYRSAPDPPQFSLDPTTYRRDSPSSVGDSLPGSFELFSPLLPTLATLCADPTHLSPRFAARETRAKRMDKVPGTDCIRLFTTIFSQTLFAGSIFIL